MAEKILIMGESGTGKSTSMRNCDPSITAIVNPVGKPLPFRGAKNFTTLNSVTNADEICNFMRAQAKAGKKIIVIDDFQYILAIPFMNRIKETGWDKYNDFGANYFSIIDVCKELPNDVCVYYMTHTETLENGVTTVKLIGKLLREKITIEGLFTIVLKTGVSEGKYYFFTQNSGKDTVKSPLGMFDAFSIENDLVYVDTKIRNYYEFDGAVTDTEMAKLDEEKAGTVEKPEGRRRRSGSAERHATNDGFVNIPDGIDEPLPITQPEEAPKRRIRSHGFVDASNVEVPFEEPEKTREEVIASNNEKMAQYVQAQADAIEKAAKGDETEVPFDEVEHVEAPKLDPVPRRRRRTAEERFSTPEPDDLPLPQDVEKYTKRERKSRED